MAHLQHLVSFAQTAEHGSFSAAARVLGPDAGRRQQERGAARSRPWRAPLPSQHASPGPDRRRRTLPAAGGRPADLAAGGRCRCSRSRRGSPAGTLKVSMGQAFGRNFLVPLLDDFLARYPAVLPDWHFDNRQVDIVGEGFDAAIGGGFELASGVVARELAPVHIVAVASPAYLVGRATAAPARRTSQPSTASCAAPRPPDGCGRGRCDRGAWPSRPCRASRGSSSATPRRWRRRHGSGSASRCCRCRSPSRRSAAANWSGCCRAGTATPGRFRCTTRAEECCRRRRGSLSTSSWSAFDRPDSLGWSMGADGEQRVRRDLCSIAWVPITTPSRRALARLPR